MIVHSIIQTHIHKEKGFLSSLLFLSFCLVPCFSSDTMDGIACIILNKLSLVDPTVATFSTYQQNAEVGQFN